MSRTNHNGYPLAVDSLVRKRGKTGSAEGQLGKVESVQGACYRVVWADTSETLNTRRELVRVRTAFTGEN